MATTRRYRKTAKPKKKVSSREALIKRVEKLTGGKVKHARDPLKFTAREVKAIYELGRASGAKGLSTKKKSTSPKKKKEIHKMSDGMGVGQITNYTWKEHDKINPRKIKSRYMLNKLNRSSPKKKK